LRAHLARQAAVGKGLKGVSSLGAIGPNAKQAVPALRAALGDDENEVRTQAEEALKLIGP